MSLERDGRRQGRSASVGLGALVAIAALVMLPAKAAATPAACPALGPTVTPIVLQNGSSAIADYLVLLTVDTATPIAASEMRPDGGDIRFAGAACAEYAYWIQTGLNTTETKIWVKVPSAPTGPSEFALYYGDLALTHTNQVTDVFGASVSALYTFTEGSGTTVKDWAGSYDLTMIGTSWTPGPRPGVGAVTGFTVGSNSTGNRLQAASAGPPLAAGDFTVIAALNPTSASLTGTHGIVGSYSSDANNGWILKTQGGPGQFMLLTNQGGGFCQSAYGAITAGNWHVVAGRRRGTPTNTLFQNGAVVGNFCANDHRDVTNAGNVFELGRGYSGNYALTGAISSVVLYSRALSDAEVTSVSRSFAANAPGSFVGGTVPTAPAIASAVTTATQISLTLSPPSFDGGHPVTGYQATCTAGERVETASGPTPAFTFTNLPQSTAFDCTVQASNTLGWSAPSPASVVATGQVPAIVSSATALFNIATPGTYTVVATGSPTPAVSVAGSLPAGIAFSPGTLTFSGTPALGTVGTYPLLITATNSAGPDAVQALSLTVAKGSQTIAFADPGSLLTGTPAVSLTATASSGLAVAFASSTPAVCRVDGAMLTPLAVGPCTVTATQPGDANFVAASAVSHSLAIVSGVPNPPIDVTAVVASDANVTVSWRPAPTGPPATRFAIESGSDRGLTTLPVYTASQTSAASLLAAGRYFIRVRAINAAGQSAPSSEVEVVVVTSLNLPRPPIGVQAGISGSRVTVAWHHPSVTAWPLGYRLELGTTLGAADLGIFDTPTPGPLSGDLPAGSYVLRLRALAKDGLTPPAQDIAFSVGPLGGCTQPPLAPVLLTPSVYGELVTLSWLPSAGARAASYVVQAGTARGASDIGSFDTASTASSLVVPALEGRYWVRVVARNACGDSVPSADEPVLVGTPVPDAPSGLTATVVGRDVTLAWQPPAWPGPITAYVLEVGATPGGVLTSSRIGADTRSLTVTGVPPGVYFVRVSAANARGAGAPSADVQVIVP